MAKFGYLIRSTREKKGITQVRFLELLENRVSKSYINQVELHNKIPSREMILDIARILEIDITQLFTAAYDDKLSEFESSLSIKYTYATRNKSISGY